jgi:hypothetical protein
MFYQCLVCVQFHRLLQFRDSGASAGAQTEKVRQRFRGFEDRDLARDFFATGSLIVLARVFKIAMGSSLTNSLTSRCRATLLTEVSIAAILTK